jgi:hypothetical protein
VELVGVAMAAVKTREGRLKLGEEERPRMVHSRQVIVGCWLLSWLDERNEKLTVWWIGTSRSII